MFPAILGVLVSINLLRTEGTVFSLVILGFLYTFALIAYAGGEVDAIEFSTYENIWTLINALQTVAYAVLISVMFSTFIIKEYAGKLNLLLFTYPVDKSTLLKAKYY